MSYFLQCAERLNLATKLQNYPGAQQIIRHKFCSITHVVWIGQFNAGLGGEDMKKIGLTFLILLIITALMAGSAQARWHGYYRGWGPGIFWGVPIVVGPLLYPFGRYPSPPVVVQQPPVYVQPQQEDAAYWYYCENPKGYYPYVSSCPSGWMKVVPNTNPQAAPPN
jgi:hypothetical protein